MLKLLKKKFGKREKVSRICPKTDEEFVRDGWIRMPEIEEIKKMETINEKIPKEIKDEVEQIIMMQFKEEIKQRRLGLCHQVWAVKKNLYAARGYEWYSPKELYPHIMYD